MPTAAKLWNRRQVLADIGGGLMGGVLLGAGFTIADKRLAHPVLAVVGRSSTQAVLIRTDSARILVTLGPWDDRVVDALLPVLGWSDRHVDLVICSIDNSDIAMAWSARQTDVRAVTSVVDDPEADMVPPAEQSVTATMSAEIATDVLLTIEPAFDYLGPEGTVVRSPWTARIRRGDLSLLLADQVEGLNVPAFHPNLSLLVVPEISPTSLISGATGDAIATNVNRWMGSQTESIDRRASTGVHIVRTFPSDPAIFELTRTGLRMPWWTEVAVVAATPTP